MRNLESRLKRLEDKAASSGVCKGIVADWALEYVRENKTWLMEGRTGEIMRELAVDLGPPLSAEEKESNIKREAQYLTETYPNFEACKRGEAKRAERVHALLAPRFKEAQQ